MCGLLGWLNIALDPPISFLFQDATDLDFNGDEEDLEAALIFTSHKIKEIIDLFLIQ